MKFKELKDPFTRFRIISSIKAERGHEIVYRNVSPHILANQYLRNMDTILNEPDRNRNENFIKWQWEHAANAMSEDGTSSIHVDSETEIETVLD